MKTSFRLNTFNKTQRKEFFDSHQHLLYELVCMQKGSLKLTIDFRTYTLKDNCIYLIKPGQIHQWSKEAFSKTSTGYIFHFSKDFLPSYDMVNALFDDTTPIVEISLDGMKNINVLISMLEKEDTNNSLRAYLFGSILEYILKFKKSDQSGDYKDKRIPQLIQLIEANFKQEKSALFYATHFNLTTKRLNELSKLYLGQTLSALIIDRNIIEIKRILTYTQLSLKEIAENLGFNDTSHFSKFFKKHTSHTPLEFKKRIKKA